MQKLGLCFSQMSRINRLIDRLIQQSSSLALTSPHYTSWVKSHLNWMSVPCTIYFGSNVKVSGWWGCKPTLWFQLDPIFNAYYVFICKKGLHQGGTFHSSLGVHETWWTMKHRGKAYFSKFFFKDAFVLSEKCQ